MHFEEARYHASQGNSTTFIAGPVQYGFPTVVQLNITIEIEERHNIVTMMYCTNLH
jgi:hypothetical protein